MTELEFEGLGALGRHQVLTTQTTGRDLQRRTELLAGGGQASIELFGGDRDPFGQAFAGRHEAPLQSSRGGLYAFAHPLQRLAEAGVRIRRCEQRSSKQPQGRQAPEHLTVHIVQLPR